MAWQTFAAIVVVFAPLIGAIIGGVVNMFTPHNDEFTSIAKAEDTDHAHDDHHGHAHIPAGRARLDKLAMAATTFLVVSAAVCAGFLFFGQFFASANGVADTYTIKLARWIDVGAMKADWAIRMDTLSIVMMFVVTSVSSLVHIYSWGYMSHDMGRARFFSYLSLFTFMMLMLVTADNFLQLFFGWEGVGLASYLLIGFWYHKPSANAASIKAFVTNRVGDVGFALGIMAVFLVFGTVEFAPVFEAIKSNATVTPFAFADAGHAQDVVLSILGVTAPALETIGVLLFIGAMGKSAQLLLHVWLPDAMEGPTPVSALIHAATMVTAGVVLVVLCSPIYQHTTYAAAIITFVGAATAIFAATVALTQNDIKRVIAYSTCSQLGYMFFAAGVGAYDAAMFHLFTHAFFKAMLFLTAGAVIHGLGDEQDMRKMGGLRSKMPIAYAMMLLGTLAITGVGIPGTHIGFAGFFSKDAILEEAFLSGGLFAQFAFWAGIVAALLTSFYSWRLMIMTFHGKTRANKHDYDHAHDAPLVMGMPLYLLATGAVLAGVVFYGAFIGKLGEVNTKFWGNSIYHAEVVHDEHYEAVDDHAPVKEHVVSADPHGDAHDTHHGAEENHGVKDDAHGDGHGGGHDDGHHGHHPPTWVLWAPFASWMTGLVLAIIFYGMLPHIPRSMGERSGPMHGFLSNKWFFDEIYDFVFVKGSKLLGDVFWKIGDQKIIDGLGPNGISNLTKAGAGGLSRLHTGYLFHYAFIILIAAVVFGAVALLGQSGAN